jgi:hypothetical protein
MSKEIFKSTYSSESLVDLERDLYECLDVAYNAKISDIPVNSDGFHKGTFTVTIIWNPEE